MPGIADSLLSVFRIERSADGLQTMSVKSDFSLSSNRLVSATNVETAVFRMSVSTATSALIVTSKVIVDDWPAASLPP